MRLHGSMGLGGLWGIFLEGINREDFKKLPGGTASRTFRLRTGCFCGDGIQLRVFERAHAY